MRIEGKLSSLANGLVNPKEILGKPIKLFGTFQIGEITEIDEEKDLYFGEVSDEAIGEVMLNNPEMSIGFCFSECNKRDYQQGGYQPTKMQEYFLKKNRGDKI